MSRDRIWKGFSWLCGVLAAALAQRLMGAGYRAVRKDTDPLSPFDPTDKRFSWSFAVRWGLAAGVGLAVAQVVSTRIAQIGWKAATGDQPPVDDE
jgi:hypothetical protein